MEGKFFKGAAMYDENADMPTPDDPEMVDLMVRRGQRVEQAVSTAHDVKPYAATPEKCSTAR